MQTIAFCELDPWCRQLLSQRWPGVDVYHDITKLDPAVLADRHGDIDLICGGFPCQDISQAGKGAGLAGKRSGLWRHFHRLIRDLRPEWVVIENVSALLTRGLGTVLGDLAAIGYDAEWHCIPAAYLGAPHRRDRVWIVAYPHSGGRQGVRIPEHPHLTGSPRGEPVRRGARGPGDGPAAIRDARRELLERRRAQRPIGWEPEPDVGRVVDELPGRVDRLRGLGNAVVPMVVEMIGTAIMEAHHGISDQG